MSEVEAQPVRRDERARLVHVPRRAPGAAPRAAGASPCDCARCRAADRSARAPWLGRSWNLPVERADRRRPAVDLAHVVDVDAPAIADDLAAVGDLAARLRVERRLAQQHRDAAVGEVPNGRDLRVDLDDVVADERRRAASPPARSSHVAQIVERVGRRRRASSPCARPASACAAPRAPPRSPRCRRCSRARAPSAP